MYSYVLQDWTTIRGANNAAPIIQNESDWIGFSSFQDIAFWIDIRNLTNNGAGVLTLNLQTAPTKDDVLFQTMTGCTTPVTVTAPFVLRCLVATAPAVPLSTWVRWSLSYSVANSWDATFRILVAANRLTA
jgi:hypothetical protein